MLVHNFDPVIIDLVFFQVRWYSVAYIVGIILSYIYINKILKIMFVRKEKYSFTPVKFAKFEDLIVYLILGIIIGGRLGYVLFYNFEYYAENILQIFKVWQGGMSFHGGLLGLIIATLLYCKITKEYFFKFTDLISCASPIGIFLVRIANFINGELYGKISTMPWAIVFPYVDNNPRHPSQLYEAILEGIVLFVIINYLAIKKNLLFKTGYISSLFLILYSALRIFSEYFREPDSHIGYFFNYFSTGTILSIITLFAGYLLIFFKQKNE
jgi:phosphatidylglycerol---prolipoprotein diacylglyceryl transferase